MADTLGSKSGGSGALGRTQTRLESGNGEGQKNVKVNGKIFWKGRVLTYVDLGLLQAFVRSVKIQYAADNTHLCALQNKLFSAVSGVSILQNSLSRVWK